MLTAAQINTAPLTNDGPGQCEPKASPSPYITGFRAYRSGRGRPSEREAIEGWLDARDKFSGRAG